MIAIHAGAGAKSDHNYARELAHLHDVAVEASLAFEAGRDALDIAVSAIETMEQSGLYVAGRGASANDLGVYELDAGVMDSKSGRIGAVTTLVGIANPVNAALHVMHDTPHVLLSGKVLRTSLQDKAWSR